MPKISLAGFKDPVRRPRFIVWTFVVVFALAAFIVVALGATSTRWFCAQVCHKVQDDTIRSYEASAHSEISCMACHEPVNGDPVTFMIKKASALGELITTVTDKYRLPLNAGSALSLNGEEMAEKQCVQCHSAQRKITPSAGIIIDHKKHEDAGIWCTVCHNRTGHNEVAAPPTLHDPTGAANTAHPDFMKMSACFRCHDLEGKVKMTGPGAKAAPGACPTCHTKDFPLVPQTHDVVDWATKAHGQAALQAIAKVATESAEAKKLAAEGVPAYLAAPVNECQTCHSETTFCTKCHGVQLPHPAGFAKDHKAPALQDIRVCQKCHLPNGPSTAVAIPSIPFCENCHHQGGAQGVPWIKAHPAVVQTKGTVGCFTCHSPVVCAKCHVHGGKLP